MSYVNSTEFYHIPLFEETDLYNPMDYNNSMEAVDIALHGAVVDAENAVSTAGTASDVATAAAAAVEQLSGDLAEANGKITVLQTNVLNLDNKVDDIKDDALDMICAFVEPTAQVGEDPESTHNYAIGDYFRYNDVLYRATAAISIGDTIIPNTNCVATNVTTELIAGVGSPSADDVSFDNTSSGLSATNVQDAIDEVSADLSANKLGTSVTISSYTTNFYTIPADGYISSYNNSTGTAGIELYSSDATQSTEPHINISASPTGREGVFVKKGMKVLVWGTQETTFYPLTY